MANVLTELIPASSLDIYPVYNFELTIKQLAQLGLNKNVAMAIHKLDKAGYSAYLKIINNNGLLLEMNNVLNIGDAKTVSEMLRLHHTIVTHNFDVLIENLFTMAHFKSRLKTLICFRLYNFYMDPQPISIFRAIYDCVLYEADKAKHDTSLIIETPANVHIAEEIESLNILKYKLILEYFNDFRHFNKESASESIIFNGLFINDNCMINQIKKRDLLLNRRIFFKIFPIGDIITTTGEMTKYDTIGLETEINIYEQLRKLVEFGVTPNILCSVYNGTIDGLEENFINNPKIDPVFREACIKDIITINTNNNVQDPNTIWKLTGIVMTIPGDSVLEDIIKICTNAERKQIMFQIIYTLYVFDQLQISHGDLHSGNIFIQNILPKNFSFDIYGRHYSFTTTKLVKIYDFDQSTICKNSNIRLDVNDSFTINSILNPNRAEGEFYNLVGAETNIYNKQLDLIILICYALGSSLSKVDYINLNFFNDIDVEFNNFIRYAMPGFYNGNVIGVNTIRDTYLYLLNNNESDRIEASRILNINIPKKSDPSFLGISDDILNMNWIQYSLAIRSNYGRIVKRFGEVPNNQLWIPDKIVIDKGYMLLSDYFSEYSIAEPFDVTQGTVYSIQTRLLA